MSRISIETTVKPTENIVKVKAAVLNIFPDARFTESQGRLVAEASSLDRLRDMFSDQRIRDTARRLLRAGAHDSRIAFSMNKEAAFVGKANFAPPSPMGPIDVVIEDENIGGVIDFLTGKPEMVAEPPPRDAH